VSEAVGDRPADGDDDDLVDDEVGPVSFGRRFAHLAATRPDDLAVVFVDVDGTESTATWAQLDARADQVARALATRGLGIGDRLALCLQNSVPLVEAIVAAWKLGAAPVPVRWDLPAWEQERVLAAIDAAVVLGPDDLDWIAASTGRDDEPLPDVTPPHTHGICSSGSTGTPKVILMNRPGTWEYETSHPFPHGWGEIPRPQVILTPTQLYHTNGFATMLSMVSGDTIVLLAKFDAGRVVDLVERHRITTFTATPTMLQRIADLPGIDERDLSSLQWVLQGAAVIPPSLVHRWIGLVGAERFFMAYGMTEGVGLAAIRGDEWLERPGSVGRGYRDTLVSIRDPDGTELAPGEIGDIYMKSPTSGMYLYLGGAARLPEAEDGFGTAGDMGFLDADGYLTIVDRRVDMIITGGANVYPAEVESALADHPGIADVVVIGLSDPEWGRRVHAVVAPADPAAPPTAADVIAYAKARLAPYKVPKTVELVDAIPRSEATKVSRQELIAARGG
jgi:bile acid-coenzyme A ligase